MVDEIKLDETIDSSENPKETIIGILDKNKKIGLISEEEKLFFIIPSISKKFIKGDNEPDKKKNYVPKTELSKREDIAFYRTFYSPDTTGIFADYDDLVAQYITKNPNAKLTFNTESGKVEVENEAVPPTEINRFLQDIQQYDIAASTFDTEGSTRRLEERQWYEILNGINTATPRVNLLYLQRAGILGKVVPDVTQQELIDNKLGEAHKLALRKFYRRRQQFWHPDRWSHSDDLTKEQKDAIEKISKKVNSMEEFTR